MLAPRAETILNLIVSKYIDQAVPVPSQSIAREPMLGVSPATIRNEMARLENEGYIVRAHHSAGSVPSDKGYRYHVESLKDVSLSESEQRLFSHLFHQVERDMEKWLSLTATLLAQQAKNMAIVTSPRSSGCRFKHMELLSLQDALALIVLVLHGTRVKEQLITFEEKVAMAVEKLAAVPGIGPENADLLVKAGFLTVEGILAADIADLKETAGFDETTAHAVYEAAVAMHPGEEQT